MTLRVTVGTSVDIRPSKGGVLNALRRSPLVGADLNLQREITTGRSIDLAS
jgi:hypothetical protein